MKKLFYIANIRMPSERAHGIQVAHMCAAFAREGFSVTLLVPDRATIADDPYAYYRVARTFAIEKISVPDTVRFGLLGFLLEAIIFAYRAVRHVRKEQQTLVYTREELPMLFLPANIPTFYEAHQMRRSFFFRRLIQRAQGVIAISQGLADAFVARVGISRERMLVAHDGYDAVQFSTHISQSEARTRLRLPHNGRIAMYIGGFEPWKGAHILCQAVPTLVLHNITVALIGGREEEIAVFKKRYPAALFLGPRPYRDLPLLQQSADVLVIPNSTRARISREFTSPLKLFAHMASGVPIVASDVPSLREVVSEKEVFLYAPDDSASLARTALAVFANGTEAAARARRALERARDFTWEKRAARVARFFSTRISR
ncbi:MAG: glycosyltransferase family 4 protein [bacterium]|nr:glycosyltransferase family 4 protein [bacterium]